MGESGIGILEACNEIRMYIISQENTAVGNDWARRNAFCLSSQREGGNKESS